MASGQEANERPPSEIITIEGHIAGEIDLIRLKIDWCEKVYDLKKAVKEERSNHPQVSRCDADKLELYKLDNNNRGYEGLENGWDLTKYMEEQVFCSQMKNLEYIHKWWQNKETSSPNEEDRIHFLVVLPDIPGVRRTREAEIEYLASSLRTWCAQPEIANPPATPETLLDLGNSFPLQQCEGLFRKLRDQMLHSFRAKYIYEKEWLKLLAIPIIGSAPGTGKTAICSRFLHCLAHRAEVFDLPPSSATSSPSASTDMHTIDSLIPQQNMNSSSCEDHPLDLWHFTPTVCDDVWDLDRLNTFKRKVIMSAKQNLYLGIDLMCRGEDYNSDQWRALLATDLLLAYSSKDGTREEWPEGASLMETLSQHENPVRLALGVLRCLQGDNVVVIHLDETQAVQYKRLQELVGILVAEMDFRRRGQVPWIFPILSGLSLETLLVSGNLSGVRIERYTPPILSVDSMLVIINEVIFGVKEPMLKDPIIPKPKVCSPNGLIRFLHDLRGPTRFFQAALYFIQNESDKVRGSAKPWKGLASLVHRDAIRAGLESIEAWRWGDVFDLVADLVHGDQLCKNITLLKEDSLLLKRLFQLSYLGSVISVRERFTIQGKTEPLSKLFEYGWITIVDAGSLRNCTVFLPFLTLYNSAPHDPEARYHPSLTPLCKSMDWELIEVDDARMLQYRLNAEFESDRHTIFLSDLFGETGHTTNIRIQLNSLFKFKSLASPIASHETLQDLWSKEEKPTIYLNADKAKFADSFVFIRTPASSNPHVLCIQSKFLQSDKSAITFSKVQDEHKKVADVCQEYSFTLIIPAEWVGAQCRELIANDATIRSSVLLLDSKGFESFYGRPMATRRKIYAGLLEQVFTQANISPVITQPKTRPGWSQKRKRTGPFSSETQKGTDAQHTKQC